MLVIGLLNVLASGYSMQVWEKLYCFSFKVVGINVPSYLQLCIRNVNLT